MLWIPGCRRKEADRGSLANDHYRNVCESGEGRKGPMEGYSKPRGFKEGWFLESSFLEELLPNNYCLYLSNNWSSQLICTWMIINIPRGSLLWSWWGCQPTQRRFAWSIYTSPAGGFGGLLWMKPKTETKWKIWSTSWSLISDHTKFHLCAIITAITVIAIVAPLHSYIHIILHLIDKLLALMRGSTCHSHSTELSK